VGSTERAGSVLAGAALLAVGAKQRGVAGVLLALAGGELVYRGASGHCMVYEALGHSSAGPSPGLRVREALTINAPAEELYRFWRPLENLPRFMKHLDAVRKTEPLEYRFTARPLGKKPIEWNVRVVAEEEGRFLAWETLPGSDLVHRGSVRFRPSTGARGTVVELDIAYQPLSGAPHAALVREELRRFKQLMETGEVPTVEGQPSGREAPAVSGGRRAAPEPPVRAEVPAGEELVEVES
jgi:uncharacterized membrane protein